MRKYNYEPAPLVVGLVLGPVMERSLRQTLIISRGNISGLWDSPLCTIMWFIILLAAVFPFVFRYLRPKIPARSKKARD
jgi:putative tricarboxylic transport membrane protein